MQAIANQSSGTRLAGTVGHDRSADYVAARATAAGYDVSSQTFEFLLVSDRTPPVLQQISPTAKTYVDGPDFQTMSYSGSGDVTAALTAVDLVVPAPGPGATTSGCEAADFAGFPAGTIALMERGTCTFRQKAENALAAGAAGVIIFNDGGDPGRVAVLSGTLNPPLFSLPTVGTSYALGLELRGGVLNGPTGVVMHLRTDTVAELRTTRNVIAETPGGDPNRVVVIGAHLDSVSRGPGINDNGSGSATILEIAETYAAQDRQPRNKLRFIWWSAEEEGLLGSAACQQPQPGGEGQDPAQSQLRHGGIAELRPLRLRRRQLVVPGRRGVQAGPLGSGLIESVFTNYFDAVGLASAPTPFNGRSDYGPFIAPAVGIPAGGLFTGAEGIKTAEQAAIYGGTAGQQYDACYHLACDTFANNSNTALDQMSDAAAHAVLFFSKTKDNVDTNPAAVASASFGSSGGLGDEHAPLAL